MSEESHDPAEAVDAAELAPGTDVGGYVIERKIGQGGMGVVYGAYQPCIGKRVAIKVLAPAYSANPTTVRRFEQEARLVNEIRHPNIVDVFQFGELPDGRCYFVMEWLDGEPLTARIARGPVPAPECIALLDVVCDALEAAHEHGVVHRDLKSDNVFIVVTPKGRTVKLLDFGLAKLAGKSDMAAVHRTRSGVIVGTRGFTLWRRTGHPAADPGECRRRRRKARAGRACCEGGPPCARREVTGPRPLTRRTRPLARPQRPLAVPSARP